MIVAGSVYLHPTSFGQGSRIANSLGVIGFDYRPIDIVNDLTIFGIFKRVVNH